MAHTTAATWLHLRDTVAALYRAVPQRASAAGFLKRAAGVAAACTDIELDRASGVRQPVSSCVAPLAADAANAPLVSILQAFLAIEPAADWLQNPNYTPATMGRRFMDGYAYVEFLGPTMAEKSLPAGADR